MGTLLHLRNEALLAEGRLQRHLGDARHDLRVLERRYLRRPAPVLAGAFALGWLFARWGTPVFLGYTLRFVVDELQRVGRLALVRALF